MLRLFPCRLPPVGLVFSQGFISVAQSLGGPLTRPGNRALPALVATTSTAQEAAASAKIVRTYSAADVAQTRLRPGLSTWVPLLLIVALGGFLRLWHLNAVGFNSDEVVYSGQAASIASDPQLTPFFPIFRAHPLLFQSILSIGYHFGFDPVFGRILAAAFGVATIILIYLIGRLLYGPKAGLMASFFLALMPYHVVVSRQVLLDGPMTFFATLALYLVARYATSARAQWILAAGAAVGLAFLSKEVGIVMFGALYTFFALAPEVAVRIRILLLSLAVSVLVILPYPLSLLFAGKSGTGGQYLAWQLFRRPNHGLAFYPSTLSVALGPALIVVAMAGLWLLRGGYSWRETLLLSWIVVPLLFFELYPVKGYQYPLPIAPAVVLLGARAVLSLSAALALYRPRLGLPVRLATPALALAIGISLFIPSWSRIEPSHAGTFLAGTGGVPGGRETGEWIARNVPEGAVLMTIGPSMANIVEFYGHRQAYGLSVSPNPLNRNPSYQPVPNPDLSIRHNDLQYLVWDTFSAARSPFFSGHILRYVDRYHGRAVHTETVPATTPSGKPVRKPIIIVYEVRP